MQVGDRVRINAMDLPTGDFIGIVKRLPNTSHCCAAVEITHKNGEPFDFDGHDCDGATPNLSGWNCFSEELGVIS